MSIIEITTGTYRSRVDGTLVLQVEIEPRHRDAALRLFGMPGTPGALAALKPASSKPKDGYADSNHSKHGDESVKPEPKERERLGELAWWCVQRCKEPEFRKWLSIAALKPVPDEIAAKGFILSYCGVQSRKELDTNLAARRVFTSKVMAPYANWLATEGTA